MATNGSSHVISTMAELEALYPDGVYPPAKVKETDRITKAYQALVEASPTSPNKASSCAMVAIVCVSVEVMGSSGRIRLKYRAQAHRQASHAARLGRTCGMQACGRAWRAARLRW